MKKSTKLIILLFVMALVYSCSQNRSRFSDAETEQLRQRFDSCVAFCNTHRLESSQLSDTMLKIFKEVGDMPAEALNEKQQSMQRQLNLNKASIYVLQGKVDSALIMMKSGLKEAEAANDTIVASSYYLKMLTLYSSWRLEKQTNMYIHKTMEVIDQIDDAHKLQCALIVGAAFIEQNKSDSALMMIKKVEKIVEGHPGDVQILYPYVKGWIYSTIPDSAAAALKTLEPMHSAMSQTPQAAKMALYDVITYCMAQAYENMGDKAKAQAMFDQVLNIVVENNNQVNYDVAKWLMKRYMKANDHARLLKLFPVWFNLQQMMYNTANSSMLTEYEVEYRVAEHKHMIEKQEWELKMKRLQNVILICVVIILLLVCAWGAWFWQVRKHKMRKLFEAIMFRYTEWHNMMLEVRNGEPLLLNVSAIGPNILLGTQENNETNDMTDENIPADEYSNTETANGQTENNDNSFNKYHALYHKVLTVMEKEKPFVNPRLTIDGLARIVGTNRTDLSFCINSMSHCNFSHWIAIYRVNYLLELYMRDKSKSLDAFTAEAGFSSRSSFYRQFKMVTGLTPAQFRNISED